MAASTLRVELTSLGKRKLTELNAKAKQFRMSPERYVRQLVEEDLALDHEARTSTFAEIMAPARAEFKKSGLSEQDLDALVDRARTRHHRAVSKNAKQGKANARE